LWLGLQRLQVRPVWLGLRVCQRLPSFCHPFCLWPVLQVPLPQQVRLVLPQGQLPQQVRRLVPSQGQRLGLVRRLQVRLVPFCPGPLRLVLLQVLGWRLALQRLGLRVPFCLGPLVLQGQRRRLVFLQ
jgi:hypothetical protein